MILTNEQMNQIDNMEIEERVELIRRIFFNGAIVDYVDGGYKVTGIEDANVSAENMEYFLKGATAMFDIAEDIAANHWHGHEDKNKLCQMENEFMLSSLETAFELINPSKMAEWKSLGDCLDKIRELEERLDKAK